MRNFKALSAILSGNWFMDKRSAESYLPLVASMLNGESISLPSRYAGEKDDAESGDANKKGTLLCYSANGGTFTASRYRSFNEAPEGSIAVIPVKGPVMKEDDGCGGIGSMSIARMVKEMNASPNIIGGLLDTDTPGGQVEGTPEAGDAIKNSKKPIIGFINNGMAASAGVWYISGATEIWASRKMDRIGSIGVYTRLADFSGYYEKMGIKIHDIYSDLSKDKNKDYYDALKGNYEGIKEELNFIAEEFRSTVKANRPKLNFKATTTGKMFHAEEAIELGLIDKIGTFEEALARVSQLANQSQSSNTNSNDTNMKITFMKAWGAVAALFSLSFAEGKDSVEKEVAAADWEKINSELAEKETLSKKVLELEKAAADANSAHATALETVNNSLTTMTTERDEWKEKAEKYGSQSGALGTSAVKEKTDNISTEEKIVAGFDPEAEHNKEAMKSLGHND